MYTIELIIKKRFIVYTAIETSTNFPVMHLHKNILVGTEIEEVGKSWGNIIRKMLDILHNYTHFNIYPSKRSCVTLLSFI